jgi:formylglycine-generating enzyme required for sulfatase activity
MNAIRRVFVSHTSEFTKHPEKKSFIDSAVAAVNRAGMVPFDMGYFTARDEKPAKYCEQQVRQCEIYIGIIGFRYGSAVRDRPEVSYTELEFNAASEPPTLTRLIFLLDQLALVPIGLFSDTKHGERQETFRKRLSDSGITCKPFTDVHELEKLIYQALIEISGSEADNGDQERIQWPEDKSPYPGLFRFDEEYAPLFFGRDREVAELITKMSEPQGRFIVISGSSGSGKSSLIGAGVWRALIKEERMPGSHNWLWRRIQPDDGKTPFEALAWHLRQTFQKLAERPDFLAVALASNQNKLRELLSQHVNSGQELILFVDQLEGLFTRGFEDKEVMAFLERLVTVAGNAENRLRVLATIRSEFVTRLEESESLRALLNTGYSYHLGRASPRTLQDMIEKPAQATGYEFEPGLVGEILDDAGQEPGHLPLIAYALKRLFECSKESKERRFTRGSYLSVGKVAGAIGTQADRVLAGLKDPELSKAFDRLFSELVHIARDGSPTRRRVPLNEVGSIQSVSGLVEALAAPDCRILVTDVQQNNPYVEVAHEKLFTAWTRLKEWIETGGDALRLIEHASEEARRWQARGAKAQESWSADRAAEVSAALKRFGKKTSPELDHFLHPQQRLIEQLDSMAMTHVERALIGSKLAEFGDSRPGVGLTADGIPDIDWINIPRGEVKLEEVKRVFKVKPFQISRYLVTNIQFEAFIKAGGYKNEEWWKGIKWGETPGQPSWNESNCPRETVSWFEAVAFCRWLSKQLKSKIRLPTEWEWQQAATGGDPAREYPWLGGWDTTRCNSDESRLNRITAVGVYANGATLQAVLDMAGNVWEWCLNKYEKPGDRSTARIDKSGNGRVLRGGSWGSSAWNLRSSLRHWQDPKFHDYSIGFRLVQNIGRRSNSSNRSKRSRRDKGSRFRVQGFKTRVDQSVNYFCD